MRLFKKIMKLILFFRLTTLIIDLVLYCHLLIHAEIYIYIYWIHTDAMIKTDTMTKTQEHFFIKILPLTLLQGFEKVVWGFTVRGSWRPNINCNILTPLLWPSRCVFLVLLMLNRKPRGSLCWVMAFFTASYQHLLRTSTHQGPKAPSAWCGFPYHISSITPSNLQLNWPELNWVI